MLLGLLRGQHDVGMDGGAYQPAVFFHCLRILGPLLVVSCGFYSFGGGDELVSKFGMLTSDFVEPFQFIVKVIIVSAVILVVEDIALLFLERDL